MDDNVVSYLTLRGLAKSRKKYVNGTPLKDYYRGTFMSDDAQILQQLGWEAPHGRVKPFMNSAIVNTLTRRDGDQMGHWVAFITQYNSGRFRLSFFDSMGYNPTKYKNMGKIVSGFQSKCRQYGIKCEIDILNKTIQPRWSQACGVYACKAVLAMWEKHTLRLREIFKHFASLTDGTSKLRKNDNKIMDYLLKVWSYCHDVKDTKFKQPLSRLLSQIRPPKFCPMKDFGMTRQCFGKNKCKCCEPHRIL